MLNESDIERIEYMIQECVEKAVLEVITYYRTERIEYMIEEKIKQAMGEHILRHHMKKHRDCKHKQ